MSGNSNYVSQGLLNWLGGAKAMPALPAIFMALFTAVGADDGTGFTEVTGGSYARQQIAGPTTTNNTTANGNAVLHYASVPSWLVAGMYAYDITAPTAIPANTKIASINVGAGTVTLDTNCAGPGVGNGDTIVFSAFAPSSGTGPSTMSNNAVITFPAATANWGTVIAFGLYDASSSGNFLEWDYMGNFPWQPFTISAASPGVLTAHAHGFAVADPVVCSFEFGGTAPSFSQSNLTGVLAVAHQTTDTFDVTNAATAVNTSGTGNGMVRKIVQQSIPSGVTAAFAANALTLTQA